MTNQINATELQINGVTYVQNGTETQEIKGDVKIVILQRGWVVIGRLEKDGEYFNLHNAKTIRRWGTKKGLGELAKEGAKAETILDECNGVVNFHQLTVVFMIACDESKWAGI